MITHRNMLTAFVPFIFHKDLGFKSEDVYLSYLPLPHLMERAIANVVFLAGAFLVYIWAEVEFPVVMCSKSGRTQLLHHRSLFLSQFPGSSIGLWRESKRCWHRWWPMRLRDRPLPRQFMRKWDWVLVAKWELWPRGVLPSTPRFSKRCRKLWAAQWSKATVKQKAPAAAYFSVERLRPSSQSCTNSA